MSKVYKALVIDDDERRVAQVMGVMPDYIDATASRFNKDAQKLIARDDGTKIDLLIMYADDERAISLYLFDWMKKDSGRLGLRNIPVVIYTYDAYSDRVMEFLEIGDVFIHEGDVDAHGFYSVLMEAIESTEAFEDDYFDAQYPDGISDTDVLDEDRDIVAEVTEKLVKNNPERLMGISINAPTGANEENRSLLIKDEDKLKSVLEAIKLSKEKSYQLRLILQDTEEDKLRREQIAKNYYTQELSDDDSDYSIVKQAGDTKKERKEERRESNTGSLTIGSVSSNFTPLPSMQDKPDKDSVFASDKYGGRMPIAGSPSQVQAASKPEAPAKKRILVIDTDVMTKFSLQYHYSNVIDVDYADSSMKAIDYFLQNKPDIVFVEYDMPYINGLMILDSIRRQPNGTNVKAVILLDVTKHSDLLGTISSRQDITGVIYKPFVKEQFIATMQRCLA